MKIVTVIKQSFLLVIIFSFELYQTRLNANPIPSGSALTIVAPTAITIPGTYRLGNDISGTVTIAVNNVELDLANRRLSAGNPNCIEVTNQADITIKNGIIDNATTNGILIDTCTNLTILDIDFIGSVTGLAVLTTTCIRVENCTFRDNSIEGACFMRTNEGFITHCKFNNNFRGIVLNRSRNMVLSHLNVTENSTDGIRLFQSNNNILKENNANDNGNRGIRLSINSNNNTLKGNVANNNVNFGIHLIFDSNNNILIENNASNNGDSGISITSSNNCVSNNITNNNSLIGIVNIGTNNSFFLNKAQQNGPSGTSNFTGVPSSIIATFDLSKGDFTGTTTNLRTGLNISVVP